MSHELRTPLNAIIGFAEIISSQLFGPVGLPRYVEYAGNIRQGGRHLLAIISSVLDLAKSEAGKLQLTVETVDLRMVLSDCVTLMGEQCRQAGLTIDSEPASEPLAVMGEPAKLRQIFLNLLSNAAKFTEAGGRISLRAGPRSQDQIAVVVADTGIGMAPEHIPIALTPFEQIDSRLARRYEGTGLGLPLAKALVELHGGRISIESQPGKGTQVTVALPRASAVDAGDGELGAAAEPIGDSSSSSRLGVQ
jgi:signal transduction histidine kinase